MQSKSNSWLPQGDMHKPAVVLALVMAAVAAAGGAEVKKLGLFDYFVDESSPVVFNGRLVMIESIVRASPYWAGNWDPRFANCSCYFRVRHMDPTNGAVIVNITETCNHAFGAGFVVTNDAGLDSMWVFGTPWIRDNVDMTSNRLDRLSWSGPCSGSGANCSVDAFWSSDPELQAWTAVPNAASLGFGVYNQVRYSCM